VLTKRSRLCTKSGNKTNPDFSSKVIFPASPRYPPKIIADIISAEIDSKRSAH
jgi:hypothetical protein